MSIRHIRIHDDVAYVPLTRGYEAIINADDLHLVSGKNWRAQLSGNTVYAVSGGGAETVKLMHRVILGDQVRNIVDHIDGNGLNNVRSNLRDATRSQNQMNRKTAKHNKSGLKGVSYDPRSKSWRARININKTRLNIGTFPSKEEAHAAYCVESKRLHMEFSRTE